ncbi:MAG: DUF4160 domain-containing protein [Proteobacteria bacterium]|nr:DUF4160 domain-containing protein [Pseudomonadota bacterium]
MAPKADCIKNQRKYVYLFYSNDHEPPHVHVMRRGEWEIKVKFLNCTKDFLDYEAVVPKREKLKSAEVQEILKDILPVKSELYDEWCKKVLTKKS